MRTKTRSAELFERPELTPETELVPASLESWENRRARAFVGPRHDASSHHGELLMLREARNSLM